MLQALLDDVYGQFVEAVAEGRGLDEKTVRGFADGRIYSGQQARALKMVDELGGLEDAIEAAAKLAGHRRAPQAHLPAASASRSRICSRTGSAWTLAARSCPRCPRSRSGPRST